MNAEISFVAFWAAKELHFYQKTDFDMNVEISFEAFGLLKSFIQCEPGVPC